jgi:P4 family phage/plasmid primase-like protien
MTLTDTLSPEHYREVIGDSAIDPDVASARGYRTLHGTAEDRDILERAGFGPQMIERDTTYPALLVPMHNAHGEIAAYQVKPAVPDVRVDRSSGRVRTLKYVSPPKRPTVVDVPEFTRQTLHDNPQASLWITEGMKKVDSLVSKGMAAVGLIGVFNWRDKQASLGDWEDIPLKGRNVVICFDADAESNRNVQLAMARLGAWLRSRGALEVKYLVVPAETNGTAVKGVDDWFAAGGTLPDLAAAAKPSAPGAATAADGTFTDAFLVEEAASEALEGKYCWAAGLGWLAWSGKTWGDVSEVEPVEAIRQWASGRFEAVLNEQRKDPAKNLSAQIAGWRGILSKARLGALVGLARGVEGVQKDPADFDSDPDLLTVQNGTLHLPSGTLGPFDPTHNITKMADADYRPGFTHPKWDKALTAIPDGIHSWYQDRMGQATTGYPIPDHQLVIAWGSGSNGKSTIVNTVRKTMGEYGVLISDRGLMASPDAHPTELMDLRGARYAVLEETPEARHLNVQRLKTTLGTEYIKARRIRQDPVEFAATHSLFINTNYRPVVTETDHGTWRRLSLLPFPFTFRKPHEPLQGPNDRHGDPSLAYAHNDPDVRAAALAWMVEGAKLWYARGRQMMENPQPVVQETREWRAETDQILGFSDDCLKFDPDAFTNTQVILTAFNDWAAERGHRPWNDKTFGARFGAHDMVQGQRVTQGRKSVAGRQQRGWFGVQIAQHNGPTPGVDPFN